MLQQSDMETVGFEHGLLQCARLPLAYIELVLLM